MKSLPPKDYGVLPKLDAPAGYICVLRDIDRDAYRIDSTDQPATYVDALLAELTGTYGIELISILETDDLVASESELFDSHHARLSDEWLDLDSHQLAELRRSELQINAHRSLYLTPQPAAKPKSAAKKQAASRYRRPAASYSRRSSSRRAYREPASDSPPRRIGLEDVTDPYTLFLYLNDRSQTLHDILNRLKETFLDYLLLWLFALIAITCALVTLMAIVHGYGGGFMVGW